MHFAIILKRLLYVGLSLVIVLLFFFTGCETSIDPYKENDFHYSIYGFLDASADTQYIRIERLRDSLLTSSSQRLNAEVTLTETNTGQTVSFRDSIFIYGGEQSSIAHNFFTDFDIKPTETYRLSVNGAQGGESSAQVTIPSSFPEPITYQVPDEVELDCAFLDTTAVIEMQGIDRLVAVNAIYHLDILENFVITSRITRTFYHLEDTVNTSIGTIRAPIEYKRDVCQIAADYSTDNLPYLSKIEIVIASGNEEWPDFINLSEETIALPNVVSNIINGTGVLGGIISDTLVIYDRPIAD